ncbi:MAG: HAMP domain-containing histidine kinase [Clostridia bacterium]|nr:HAMP domain-containing histidine kinase [Clostridia bacterium]
MIYRLQRKFILICALSIFAVIILIYGIISVLNISSMNKTLDTLTDSLSLGDGNFPDSFGSRPPRPGEPMSDDGAAFITPETRFSTRYFTVWFDGSGNVARSDTESIYAVDHEAAEAYAGEVLKREKDRGWVDNYRYKVFDTQTGRAVVFVDGTMNRSGLAQSLLISGMVLISSALVILCLIVIFSGRVMKPIAESYEKQKQFITDANHELKTPLTLILANLDIAEAELGENEWLNDIRSEGHRMTELVNQLVSLSRMDEDERGLREAELSVSEIVSDTVSEFEALSAHRGKLLRSQVSEGILCRGDEALLRRLVVILLDNAVKYCDEGGEIEVTLRKRRHIVLTVENTYGAVDGIALDRLFDRFYRADKARTYTGGFGVGLSIAKSIVSKHRGEISAYRKDTTHIGFKVVLKT